MNIIIPLAGSDKNFESLGNHKVLTEVFGKTIIEWIAETRPFDYSDAIFILLREHQKKYSIDSKLKKIFGKNIKIVWAEKPTEGSPQTVLLAKKLINNDEPLIIDLVDQYIDFGDMMNFLKTTKYDGVIPTFESLYYNRGYMILNDKNEVLRVSEKDKTPISTHSTACISFFKKGSDFVWAAEEMVKNKRVAANGAYLISLAYNELIRKGKKIGTYPCEFIATLGTIAGMNAFEQIVRPVKPQRAT